MNISRFDLVSVSDRNEAPTVHIHLDEISDRFIVVKDVSFHYYRKHPHILRPDTFLGTNRAETMKFICYDKLMKIYSR